MAKILICDDSGFMRSVMKEILNEAGHEVIAEAEDLQGAVNLYKEYNPDLVTMDILIKEKSGIDALKEIIKIDANAKIVMISSIGEQATAVAAVRAGAKGFMIKPFSPETLVAEVKRILG